jgi:hypothetical protein
VKICERCKQEKDDSCFYKRSKDGNVRSPCKECISRHNLTDRAKGQRADYRENGGAATARSRELKRCYGISIDDYHQLVELQGGGCDICGRKESGQVRQKAFHVDHDHKTNRVRGVLCSRCNHLIGLANDNPDTLLSAAEYLKSCLPEFDASQEREVTYRET